MRSSQAYISLFGFRFIQRLEFLTAFVNMLRLSYLLCVLLFQSVRATLEFSVSLDLSTSNFAFTPPIGSDQLFLALEARYPLISDHDQRILAAITDHCISLEAPHYVKACQSSGSSQPSFWQPQLLATTSHDTSTANDSLRAVQHPDVGIFKPKLQNRKLLGQKFNDYASGLKEGLLINFDLGLPKIKKNRKPRERLDGQKAVDYRTLRYVGACEKHKRAKRKVSTHHCFRRTELMGQV